VEVDPRRHREREPGLRGRRPFRGGEQSCERPVNWTGCSRPSSRRWRANAVARVRTKCYNPAPRSLAIMDETFMAQALAEARLAAEEGEVPIGAVVVVDGRVVGRDATRVNAFAIPPRTPRSWPCRRRRGRWRVGGFPGDDVRDPRALPDVRRSAGQRAHRPAGVRSRGPPRPERLTPCSTWCATGD